jgi:hypothetical protein
LGEESDDEDDNGSSESSSEDESYRSENQQEYDETCWTIQSCNPQNGSLVVTFLNEAYYNNADCKPSNDFYATIWVQPVDKNAQLKRNELRKYRYSHSRQYMNHLGSKLFHKISLAVTSNGYDGSWGVSDIWGSRTTVCNDLSKEIQLLGLEGLTEDLLMIYLIAVIQPKLKFDGDVPFTGYINKCKSAGKIPIQPNNHLWLDLWRLYV